jgi:translation initiation factor 2B subunit (eIF-2B alpha/beta/delta family)
MNVARKITIREVARLAEVSVGTVSNVLNGAANVSDTTRQRVSRVIDDLGFTPDNVARSLISRKRPEAADTLTRHYAAAMAAQDFPAPDQTSLELLPQILDERVLGATRHVRLAHRLLIQMADSAGKADRAWRAIAATADYIVATRGADVPLLSNGIAWLMSDIAAFPPAKRAERLASRVEQWESEAKLRLDRLVEVGVALMGANARPVLLDYSSTVAAIIEALHERRLNPMPIVLENRGLGGGIRYINQFLARGLDLQLAPDAAIEHVLGKASSVLIGCESLHCDGSVVNSLGSKPLARIARALEVPVYCCAELFKLDIRSYAGAAALSSSRTYDFPWIHEISVPEGRRVDATVPAVEIVPAAFLTAIVTEEGPVPPAALWSLGRTLFKDRIGAAGMQTG